MSGAERRRVPDPPARDEDEALVEALLAGERRALARLLTRVEDGSEARLRAVVRRIHPHTGRAQIVGVTGSPGVGKSTLTNALVDTWRGRDLTVAVLAVDPSSPFSGGALLGDRVRMQDHTLDEGVFIRSMASRGHLGGLSWATPQALLLLDGAGFDLVVVETVGVGQAEVEIAAVADTTVVTVAPGMGDAIQAAKAGILEVADVLCVNKADRDGADRTVRELREMQQLGEGSGAGDWTPPIVRTVAADGSGAAELADAVEAHWRWLAGSGRREARALDRARLQIRELALGSVRRRFATLGEGAVVDALARRVAARELDPYRAADELLAEL
jgi:LAO/AO transport system kinase